MTFLLALFLAASSASSSETAIRAVLRSQVAAWNRGDIPGFMSGYDDAETTTSVSSSIRRGYQQMLAGYLRSYPTREKMGTLAFSEVEVRMLGGAWASVLGRWHLTRASDAGGDVGGYFTLLFQNKPRGWKVILDHTSEEPRIIP
jgi:uncharacterized protein (TIGR02246 family)